MVRFSNCVVGSIGEFNGDLDDYQKLLIQKNREYNEKIKGQSAPSLSRAAGYEKNEQENSVRKNRDRKKADAAFRQSLRPLKLELEKLEKQMDCNKQKLSEIDSKLADPALYENDKEKVSQLLKERADTAASNEELELSWLEKSEEIERRSQEYEQQSEL